MRQFHGGELRFERFREHAVIVDADHGNVLAHGESATRGAFVHIPGACVVETEESIGMFPLEQVIHGTQCGAIVHHIADQRIIEITSGVVQGRAVSGETPMLGNYVFRTSDVRDALAVRPEQAVRRVVCDGELVGLHAGDLSRRVGGVHHHHGIVVQRRRHGSDAVRHLRIQESIHAVTFQGRNLLLLARRAIGTDGE